MTYSYRNALLCAVATIAAACGGSGSPGGDETGLLSLGVSDAPVHDLQKVCITFDDVELKHAGDGPPFLVDLPQTTINLLDFQGMNAAPLLFNEEVPAGEYNWMRLVIDASLGSNGGAGDTLDPDVCDGEASYVVTTDGTVHNLYVPSGDQTGLKLINGFIVPVNGSADFTAEWDLLRSIVEPPGLAADVALRPVIKLVSNAEVGALRGTVAEGLAAAESCDASIFVFDNTDADASDVGVADAVASDMVKEVDSGDGSTSYFYEIGFLLEGSYEVAFSCDGVEYVEPEEGNPFDIVSGEVTEIDLS